MSNNKIFNREKPQAKPMKSNPDSLPDLEYGTNSEISDYVQVMFGGPGIHPEAITIHRPIGVTRLGKDNWIASRTADVHFLLAGKRDPDEDKITKMANAVCVKHFLSTKQLLGTEDDPLYPSDKVSGESKRNIRLKEASESMNKDLSECQKRHKEESKNKPIAPRFGYSKTKYDFMADDMKKYEKELQAAKHDDPGLKSKLASVSSTYVTRGGPGQNEEQIPIPLFRGIDRMGVATLTFREVIGAMNGRGTTSNPRMTPFFGKTDEGKESSSSPPGEEEKKKGPGDGYRQILLDLMPLLEWSETVSTPKGVPLWKVVKSRFKSLEGMNPGE